MILRDFEQVFEMVRGFQQPKRMLVVGAGSKNVLEGAFAGQREGLAVPILIGRRDLILRLVEEGGWEDRPHSILDCEEGKASAELAAGMAAEGEGDCLMKGLIESSDFLRPIVSSKYGLRAGGLVSQVGFAQLPGYGKLVAVSDAAVVPFPDIDKKQHMVENIITAFRALGVERPSIGLLSALEAESPNIPDTSDAVELMRRWREGAMSGCDLVGPISYDLAFSRESADIKGYDCPHCGAFDAIVCPNIVVANVLVKCWNVTFGIPEGGVIMGTKVPIILNSRSMPAGDRLRSTAVAMAVADGMK